MKPMKQPFDARSRFIYMVQLLYQQQALEGVHCWDERAGGFLDPIEERSLGKRTRELIKEDLANAFHRQ